ncbi:MAG: hypothetical protein JJU36_06525 [Phycisphaeraceae bacterium]|nr:hypothetical protein [Phycisphaeraceae bacterium]
MKLTRIHNDASGTSRFGEVEIELRDHGIIGLLSEPLPCQSVIFRRNEAGYAYDWHPAPRRQLIVMLDGSIEIETGDGEIRTFSAGDILLVEDTTGKGHRTRSLTGDARHSLFIPLRD